MANPPHWLMRLDQAGRNANPRGMMAYRHRSCGFWLWLVGVVGARTHGHDTVSGLSVLCWPLRSASTYNHVVGRGANWILIGGYFTGRHILGVFGWAGYPTLSDVDETPIRCASKRLDGADLEERKAATLRIPVERRIFPEGKDEKGRPYTDFAGGGSSRSRPG